MSFKATNLSVCILAICLLCSGVLSAAEWKSEPSLFMRGQYNDNVRMRNDELKESSTGFTLDPRVKFAGEELQRWDMSIDTRAKITRFQDIEDGDSENLFFDFDSGYQTELTDWRLGANYSNNTNFDTDFDTSNPDAGIGDRTERTSVSVTPSVLWSTSETSQVRFNLNSTQVTYDEVTSLNYTDYDYNSLSFVAYWLLAENHQLGFTSSYSEYDSPDSNFSYDQTVLQFDYTYNINPTSDLSLSLGGRRLDSIRTVVIPVVEDISNQDDGTVVNLSYSTQSETASHRFSGGRTIVPSSFGGAQEVRSATYQFNIRNTERFSTNLLLDGSESSTVNGTASSFLDDRTQFRIEPSVTYRLSKNWNLQFLYRHINREYTNSIIDRDATSNAVFINLFLHWPKFVTTY